MLPQMNINKKFSLTYMRNKKHGGTSLSKCRIITGELLFLTQEYRIFFGKLPEKMESVCSSKLQNLKFQEVLVVALASSNSLMCSSNAHFLM